MSHLSFSLNSQQFISLRTSAERINFVFQNIKTWDQIVKDVHRAVREFKCENEESLRYRNDSQGSFENISSHNKMSNDLNSKKLLTAEECYDDNNEDIIRNAINSNNIIPKSINDHCSESIISEKQKAKNSFYKEIPNEHQKHCDLQMRSDSKQTLIKFYYSCQIHDLPLKGRHLISNDFIPANDIIFNEKPYVGILLQNHLYSHCQNCFKRIENQTYPCLHCDQVVFCDEECFHDGWQKFHRYECGLTVFLVTISTAAHLVFRVLIRIGCEKALMMEQLIENNENNFEREEQFINNYLMLQHNLQTVEENEKILYQIMRSLIHHREEPELMASTTCQALEILALLLYCGVYQTCDNQKVIKLAALIQTHIHRVLTNSYGCFIKNDGSNDHITSMVMLFSALINHSCNPNVSWKIESNQIVMQAMNDIKPGEEMTISYGPTFLTTTFIKRQIMLKRRYHFSCNCSACINDIKTTPVLQCFNCIPGYVPYDINSFENKHCFCCGKVYLNFIDSISEVDDIICIFNSMGDNIESGINVNNSLRIIEDSIKVLSKMIFYKSEHLLNLRRRISSLYEKLQIFPLALKHRKDIIMSQIQHKSDHYLEDLCALKNNYHLFTQEICVDRNEVKNCLQLIMEEINFTLQNGNNLDARNQSDDNKMVRCLQIIDDHINGL